MLSARFLCFLVAGNSSGLCANKDLKGSFAFYFHCTLCFAFLCSEKYAVRIAMANKETARHTTRKHQEKAPCLPIFVNVVNIFQPPSHLELDCLISKIFRPLLLQKLRRDIQRENTKRRHLVYKMRNFYTI